MAIDERQEPQNELDANPKARLAESVGSYDHSAGHFAARYAEADTSKLRRIFQDQLPANSLPVLDAGCGTGRDLRGFAKAGAVAIGADLSRGLLAEARLSGVTAPLITSDIRALPLGNGAIRGVWAMASLVHMDAEEVGVALREFARVTATGGPIFVSLMEGSGSSWREDPNGRRRWFVEHQFEDAIEVGLRASLVLQSDTRTPGSIGGQWLNLVFKARSVV